MMRRLLSSFLSTICAVAAALVAVPARASDNAISCVQEMTMPSAYSSIFSYLPAKVEVTVEIGLNGKARSVAYDTSVKAIQLQLDGYFKEKARYRDGCRGETISFRVEYIVEGLALDFPGSEVRLIPPDKFVVVCRPLKPALDPVRRQLK